MSAPETGGAVFRAHRGTGNFHFNRGSGGFFRSSRFFHHRTALRAFQRGIAHRVQGLYLLGVQRGVEHIQVIHISLVDRVPVVDAKVRFEGVIAGLHDVRSQRGVPGIGEVGAVLIVVRGVIPQFAVHIQLGADRLLAVAAGLFLAGADDGEHCPFTLADHGAFIGEGSHPGPAGGSVFRVGSHIAAPDGREILGRPVGLCNVHPGYVRGGIRAFHVVADLQRGAVVAQPVRVHPVGNGPDVGVGGLQAQVQAIGAVDVQCFADRAFAVQQLGIGCFHNGFVRAVQQGIILCLFAVGDGFVAFVFTVKGDVGKRFRQFGSFRRRKAAHAQCERGTQDQGKPFLHVGVPPLSFGFFIV